jgi:hypothetical protein
MNNLTLQEIVFVGMTESETVMVDKKELEEYLTKEKE